MLVHKGTQTIETPRLILRRFTPYDAPAMFRNWASDPEVTKYLTWPTHQNMNVTASVLQDWVNSYQRQIITSGRSLSRKTAQSLSVPSVATREMTGSEKSKWATVWENVGGARESWQRRWER